MMVTPLATLQGKLKNTHNHIQHGGTGHQWWGAGHHSLLFFNFPCRVAGGGGVRAAVGECDGRVGGPAADVQEHECEAFEI